MLLTPCRFNGPHPAPGYVRDASLPAGWPRFVSVWLWLERTSQSLSFLLSSVTVVFGHSTEEVEAEEQTARPKGRMLKGCLNPVSQQVEVQRET